MILKLLIQNLRFHRWVPLAPLFGYLASLLLGSLLMFLARTIDPAMQDWFAAGSLCGIIGLICFSFFSYARCHQHMMLSLSMGRTRRETILLYGLEQLIWTVAAYIPLIGFAWLETVIYQVLFPQGSESFSILRLLINWKFYIPAIGFMVIVPIFFGALYSRFQQKAVVIVMLTWVCLMTMFPWLISHAQHGDSPHSLDRVFGWMLHVTPTGWMLIGIAAAASMIAAVQYLGKKQAVW